MMDIKQELRACARPGNLYQRALIRIMKLEGDCYAYERTMQEIAKVKPEGRFAGLRLSELAGGGVYGWHPGDDA